MFTRISKLFMRYDFYHWLLAFFLILPFVFVLTGNYQFRLWSQVKNFYGIKHDHSKKYDDKYRMYAHMPRSLLNYPVYKISQMSDHQYLDKVFSFQVIFNFLFTAFILMGVLKGYGLSKYFIFYFWGVLIFFSLFMNGRLSFVFLGHALLIKYYEGKEMMQGFWVRSALLFLCLLLCSVSAGTFILTYLLCFFMLVKNIFSKKSRSIYLPESFILMIYCPFFLLSLLMAMSYYKYSFWQLLSHGWGIMLHENLVLWPLFILMAIFIILKRKFLLSRINFSSFTFVKLSILFSLIGGVFGRAGFYGFFAIYLFLSGYVLHNLLNSSRLSINKV